MRSAGPGMLVPVAVVPFKTLASLTAVLAAVLCSCSGSSALPVGTPAAAASPAAGPGAAPLPPTFGFNYDHFAPVRAAAAGGAGGGGTHGSGAEDEGCLMVLEDLLALPDTPASLSQAFDAHLHRDFSAMRLLNATAVRLFLSLNAVLLSPTAPNATALARLQRVVDIAAQEGLLVSDLPCNVRREGA